MAWYRVARGDGRGGEYFWEVWVVPKLPRGWELLPSSSVVVGPLFCFRGLLVLLRVVFERRSTSFGMFARVA